MQSAAIRFGGHASEPEKCLGRSKSRWERFRTLCNNEALTGQAERMPRPHRAPTSDPVDRLDRHPRTGRGPDTGTRIANRDSAQTRGRVLLSGAADRKSTRLNSSHVAISYAVF